MRAQRPALLVAALALVGLGVIGCGDDGGEGEAPPQPVGGELFSQTSHGGTLEPVAGEDEVFTLTLTDPAPTVTAFTDRPVRSADAEPLDEFVSSWAGRGFEDDPPNAALVLDQEPDDADTAVFTLSDPSLSTGGAVSYTATRIEEGSSGLPLHTAADLPSQFGDAHLFIDPSGGGGTQELAVDAMGNPNRHVRLTFNPPWTVVLGAGEQGAAYLVGPNPGGGTVEPSFVDLFSVGSVEFALSGGTCPITGTAQVPSGGRAQVQVGNGPEQPIRNGAFSITC
jgi:hypothetical protein